MRRIKESFHRGSGVSPEVGFLIAGETPGSRDGRSRARHLSHDEKTTVSQDRNAAWHYPLWFALYCAFLLFMLGCRGDDGRVPVHPASGKVTHQGKPAKGVVLQLLPVDVESVASKADLKPGALSKEDGQYEVMTYQSGDGAPEGTYKVILFWPPEVGDPFAEMQQDRKRASQPQSIPGGPPDRFAGKYFYADKSKWEVTIEAKKNQLPDIDIP